MEIKRDIRNEIEAHLSQKEITLITGARQVGKTTLLEEIGAQLRRENKHVLFLNLDIDSHRPYFKSQETLLQKINLELGEEGYVFLDEIQRLEDAGLFLKGLYDRMLPYKFVVTGSGSTELKEKIPESLMGRKRIFEMMPVSFKEFVHYKTGYHYETKTAQFFDVEKGKTLQLLQEYLNFGGYPRVVTEKIQGEKQKIMAEIFSSYVEKDLVYLLKLERPEVFQQMIKVLAAQIGGLVNFSKLASQIHVSIPTLKKYLWYAEKTFCLGLTTPWYTNKLKEITKSPVYYFNDLGMRNYALNMMGNLSENHQMGFVFQNFVYVLLKELTGKNNGTLHYWRTTDKAEVDFVIQQGNEVLPVEVKFGEMKEPAITRSFRSFIDKYSPREAWLVNRKLDTQYKVNDTMVRFLPFYRLCLGECKVI